jgi:hypothetical protein
MLLAHDDLITLRTEKQMKITRCELKMHQSGFISEIQRFRLASWWRWTFKKKTIRGARERSLDAVWRGGGGRHGCLGRGGWWLRAARRGRAAGVPLSLDNLSENNFLMINPILTFKT